MNFREYASDNRVLPHQKKRTPRSSSPLNGASWKQSISARGFFSLSQLCPCPSGPAAFLGEFFFPPVSNSSIFPLAIPRPAKTPISNSPEACRAFVFLLFSPRGTQEERRFILPQQRFQRRKYDGSGIFPKAGWGAFGTPAFHKIDANF